MVDLRLGLVAALMLLAHTSSAELSVESLTLRSHIKYRFATTLVTSTVVNRDEAGSKEAFFEVILPEEAFIANFSMTVDGEVYPGRVEEKEKARAAYNEAKSQGQSAGYIKTTARHSNKFDVSVNLKAGSEVTFNLTYQQLLPRCHGLYEHKMHINSKHPVPNLEVEVFIEELREIKELKSEFVEGENSIPKVDELVIIEEPSPTTRYIRFQPSEDQQGTAGVDRRFVVKYDVERSSPGGEMMVMDGYFLHFFAPENADDLKPIPKDIVFILDVSGSMSGSRIQQLKEAMSTIVSELSPKDSFNILTFSSQVHRWRDKMLPASQMYRVQALDYVSNLEARGSTNINSALLDGVSFLHEQGNLKHVPLIFFLTDGEPTVGVKSASTIADNVQRQNEDVASVFGLAFGEGADFNFLKVISVQNNGFARKIYEAADASKQVKGFYDEISTTMLRNLTVTYVNGSVLTDTVTPTFFRNVFDGTDVVIAGRYTTTEDDNSTNLIATMLSSDSGDGIIHLTRGPTICVLPPPRPPPMPVKDIQQLPVDMASVIEKSWAYITIKNLLKEKKKSTYEGGSSNIDDQILKMSLKYNFVTPLTSMVATKPDQTKTKARVEGDEFDSEDQPSSRPRYSYAGTGSSGTSKRRKSRKRMPNSHYGRAVGVQHYPSNPSLSLAGASGPGGAYGQMIRRQYMPQPAFDMMPRYTTYMLPPQVGYLTRAPSPPPTMRPTSSQPQTTTVRPIPTAVRRFPTTVRPLPTTEPNHPVKPVKPARKCRIVKSLLGYGVNTGGQVSCVRVKRARPGVYQLLPNNEEMSVHVSYAAGSRKARVNGISITSADSNITFDIQMNPQNKTSDVWKYNSTFGTVSVHKEVKCTGRRGWVTYFVMMQLFDDAVDSGKSAINKRDVRGKINRLKKKIKKAKKKMRKNNLFKRVCTGSYSKENLYSGSSRYIASPSPITGLHKTVNM